MKHKLLIIDGHSTVGKSSLSKSIYTQIANHNEVYWLHEECENHPIRDGEFIAGDIHTMEGMELNMNLMLKKWRQLTETIQSGNKICVLEGCFLHSLDRYILQSAWNEVQICNYFNEIVNILLPLNPIVIYLYRPDIKRSFEKAFLARGDHWRDLILGKPEPYGYFRCNKYTGDESIYKSLLYEQEQMDKIFNVLSCDKLKVDTTEEQWEEYVQEIIQALGYEYKRQERKIPKVCKYCGEYRRKDGEYIWKISYDEDNKCMYTSLFWPYMPMSYLGNDMYELISFPVNLSFVENGEQISFTVSGNYDWKLNGETFIKINK